MSVSITIHSVPDAVRDELAARAARSARSLQQPLTMRGASRVPQLATRSPKVRRYAVGPTA